MLPFKFLQIKEGNFIITNLFEVLFTLITLVVSMRVWLSKHFYHL